MSSIPFIDAEFVEFANGYARSRAFRRNWLADPEDLASEGMMRLVVAVQGGSFVPTSGDDVRRYVARCICAANTDYVRRRRATKRGDGDQPVSMTAFDGEEGQSASFEDHSAAVVQARMELDEALALLSPRRRLVVTLQAEGHTTEEIADALKERGMACSLGTVSRERHAAADRLRTLLAE